MDGYALRVLKTPTHFNRPFDYFQCAEALNGPDLNALGGLFSAESPWQSRTESFYRCFIRDITPEVSPRLKQSVGGRMAQLTGLALADHVHITAQRMEPGQWIGAHSDRPLIGYEIARLVVYLNHQWEPSHGGVLELLSSEGGSAAAQMAPRYNHAFGFVLHPGSFHRVTEVSQPRWSVVFNFWHPANLPALAEALTEWMGTPRFGDLPNRLNAVAAEAESRLPETVTYEASLAAWLLHRLGYAPEVVLQGYRLAADIHQPKPEDPEEACAILLAVWLARLFQGHFDPAEWEVLRASVGDVARFARLKDIGRLSVPLL